MIEAIGLIGYLVVGLYVAITEVVPNRYGDYGFAEVLEVVLVSLFWLPLIIITVSLLNWHCLLDTLIIRP